MASFGARLENFIGRCLVSIRHHDAKLFTRTPAFKVLPNPTITVISPECDGADPHLQIHQTPEGANRFPRLQWAINDDDHARDGVAEYIVVVEDPDAPLPSPVVHGIYYGIPPSKTSLNPEDFEPTPGSGGTVLHGEFRYGRNRMNSIWGGPNRYWAMARIDICFRSWA